MARVSAAKNRSESYTSRQAAPELSRSINTLRSEQELEEALGLTYKDKFRRGCKTLFNFTIAACFTCNEHKGYQLQEDTELQEDTGSTVDVQMAAMRESLNFHFMNPFQKWKHNKKRRFPWKLLVQLISIILVTTQLVLFAHTKFALITFTLANKATFVQLFVKESSEPDPDDPLPNPISTLYTHEHLQEQFNFTIDQYFDLNNLAVGTYGYSWGNVTPQIDVVIEKYRQSRIDPAGKIFTIHGGTVNENYTIYKNSAHDLNWTTIQSELSQTVRISQYFNISSIFVSEDTAECVQFHVELYIKNDRNSGTMPITMTVKNDITKCTNDSTPKSESIVLSSSVATIVDAVVMFFALISIIQCFRSLSSSMGLSRKVRTFFLDYYSYRLKYHEIVPLFNMWFIGVIISNLLVLLGCILKLLIAYNTITNLFLVDLTSIVIGLAVFGQWSGILRFLSYFDKYNMLLITLRLSIPSVIRFIICTGILYIAFLLCGWLVLGPYHPKFRDPFITSDTLFSLINGDDMFATYKGMSTTSTTAYVFSKIYLYVFIALFIYVVLSVFISLISDTYETLHEHWYERSKGLLVDFATGKLGQPHYHNPPGSTPPAQSDSLHNDHTVEGDYEYLREASNRFGPAVGEDRPLVCNGGPELRRSKASLDSEANRIRTRSVGEQPHVQIQNLQFVSSGSLNT